MFLPKSVTPCVALVFFRLYAILPNNKLKEVIMSLFKSCCSRNGTLDHKLVRIHAPEIRKVLSKFPATFQINRCVNLRGENVPEHKAWEITLLGVVSGLVDLEVIGQKVTKR